MSTNKFFQIFNSNRQPITLSEPSANPEDSIDTWVAELENGGATWLGYGLEPTWNDLVDDIVGNRDSKNTISMIKTLSDMARHNAYRVVFVDGVEVHEYTHRKQYGLSEGAFVYKNDASPLGWGRGDYVGDRRILVPFNVRKQKNVDAASGTVSWETIQESPVPQGVAERHNLVSYLKSDRFERMRVRLAPWHRAYLAVFLSQWLNDDDEAAWTARVNRIGQAREWATKVKPVISKAYNLPTGKNLVDTTEPRKPINFKTINDTTVNLWDLPAGKHEYQLALNGEILEHGKTFSWNPAAVTEWEITAAEGLAATRFTLVYPQQ